MVEDSYNGDRQGQVRNLLHLENLSRDLLDARFTCRASNNNITQPLDASIVINMTCEGRCFIDSNITYQGRFSTLGHDAFSRYIS